jgi:uncharacterized protein
MPIRLLPSDDKFFALFNDQAANVADAARHLRQLLNGAEDGLEAVVASEQRGDELVRAITHRLDTSFVTPFDREDIHALASHLDAAVDDILSAAHRFALGSWDVVTMPELKLQADLLVQMADEAVALVKRLASLKGTTPHLAVLSNLETEGDVIYRRALSRLYSGELEPAATIYWKDVVDELEDALDTLEDAAEALESIVLKHA